MNNKAKNKITEKISLLTFGNSNFNAIKASSLNAKSNNNNEENYNKNKVNSEFQNPSFHKRSYSSYKYKNISNNNANNINLDNIITNIPNPKDDFNNNIVYITNNNNNNEKQVDNQIFNSYQTTNSFINIIKPSKRYRSLSPNNVKNKKKYLLPKKTSNKKTLVLDLDETLVHSCGFPFVCPSDFIVQIEQDNEVHDIYVLVRPYVEEFLEKMSQKFELVIFTASISNYANPLLNVIDRKGYIPFRLFREHCTLINTSFVKDLNLLGRDLKDIIILDNNPTAYSFNHDNGFPIKSWFEDKNDDELLKIIPILEFLSYVPDVRDYIKKIVSQNQVKFDQVKQIIRNYNNNLKKKIIRPECKKIYDLFKDDINNKSKMLQKSKSTKLSIMKTSNSNGNNYNNPKKNINNYTNININNHVNYNKIIQSDDNNNNSYLLEHKNNKIKNINLRVVKNRLTGKKIIKKKDILSNQNNFWKRKKMEINSMRYNFSNNKIVNDKKNKNISSNCIINNINNININISNICPNNRNNITENINIKHINNSSSCIKHQRIFFNNNLDNKRKISANTSETRNKKIYNQGGSKENSINNKGLSLKLNQSQKSRQYNKFRNKVQLINVGGGLKIDIKSLREQFKIYLKDYRKERNNHEKILRQIFKNKSINLNKSQKLEN